jgi:hypothetical protein
MRIASIVILMAALFAAPDFHCNVNCPNGYHGGCIKSSQGCDCSCRENANDLYEDLIRFLKRSEVSPELLEKAKAYIQAHREQSSEMTFRDKKTDKQYTILLKEFSHERKD